MGLVLRERDTWVTRWDAGPRRPADPAAHLRAAQAEVRAQGGGELVLWVERVDDTLDAAARAGGLEPWRDLLQMRCPLPAVPAAVPTRPFTPADIDGFLAVNNRAFHWHPEQGGMTRADVEARMAEPWFDPDGFRILEVDGAVAAFCWTKIHPATPELGDPPLGEIYVIAVDPDHHGTGLGKALTLAGLEWLAGRGMRTGMLYVEHDNEAAVRTYERIGFTVHHVDRAYRGVVG
jgi:mycothiol synthase